MYVTAPACFSRSGVTKMPLITASHFFPLRAAIKPGKAVLSAFAPLPNVAASFVAISTSKPMMFPLVVVYSIGGNVGSVQYVNVPACRLAPAVPATASVATASESTPSVRFMDASSSR